MDDDIAGGDFKGDQDGFENEEIPSGSETKGFVDVAAGESDKGGGNGEVGDHFGEAEGYGEDDCAPFFSSLVFTVWSFGEEQEDTKK